MKIAYVSKNENGAVSVTESLDVELTDFYSVLKVNMNVEDNADSKAGIADVYKRQVCGKAKEKRREDLERITSGYGTQLRMNRRIQTEGLDKCAFSAVQVL